MLLYSTKNNYSKNFYATVVNSVKRVWLSQNRVTGLPGLSAVAAWVAAVWVVAAAALLPVTGLLPRMVANGLSEESLLSSGPLCTCSDPIESLTTRLIDLRPPKHRMTTLRGRSSWQSGHRSGQFWAQGLQPSHCWQQTVIVTGGRVSKWQILQDSVVVTALETAASLELWSAFSCFLSCLPW